MKIMKDKDWIFRGYVENFLDIGRVFLFEHKRYGEIIALKVAKFITSKLDVVLHLNAESDEKVWVSESRKESLLKLMKLQDQAVMQFESVMSTL